VGESGWSAVRGLECAELMARAVAGPYGRMGDGLWPIVR
jgi:hypothetical protein